MRACLVGWFVGLLARHGTRITLVCEPKGHKASRTELGPTNGWHLSSAQLRNKIEITNLERRRRRRRKFNQREKKEEKHKTTTTKINVDAASVRRHLHTIILNHLTPTRLCSPFCGKETHIRANCRSCLKRTLIKQIVSNTARCTWRLPFVSSNKKWFRLSSFLRNLARFVSAASVKRTRDR